MPTREPVDLFDSVRDGLSQLLGDGSRSREERLIARSQAKKRRWRRHRRMFTVVGLGLVSLNVVIAIATGITFPWAAFPIIGWGMGFALHGLSYQSWVRDNATGIAEAERRLGLPAASEVRAPVSPALLVEGVAIVDPVWRALVERGRASVARARQAIAASQSEAVGAFELESSLGEGLERLERLAQGSARIRSALLEVVPRGVEGLSKEIARLDAMIASRGHDDVKTAYLENRALLKAKRAKVESLETEAERMLATAEGFLLAAENLRLDVARVDLDGSSVSQAMAGQVERLGREVAMLQRVEAELKRL